MTDFTGGDKVPTRSDTEFSYRRTQKGTAMTGIVLAGLACVIILMNQRGFRRVLVFYMVLLGVFALLFSSMTVTVGRDLLTVRFGLGIIRKRFVLSDIASCRVVKNPWHYGWGIRRIPGGWFFGVSGLSAVEIGMRSGKRYRIGSDIPEELRAAILDRTGPLEEV